MEPGTVEWVERELAAAEGPVAVAALEALMREQGADAEEVAALHARLRRSPRLLTLPDRTVDMTRRHLRGAGFRYALSGWELAHGVLSLEGTELLLVLGQGPRPENQAVRWAEPGAAPQHVLLARRDGPDRRPAWVLPGLGGFFAKHGVEAWDDLVVKVREVGLPLLELAHVPRRSRDEAAIARRNADLLEAAARLLGEAGHWVALSWVLKQLLGRYDYRAEPPPDALGRHLVLADPRFLVSPEGDEVREAHFHDEATAMRFLSRLGSPEQALSAYFEELPAAMAPSRVEALARLGALWRRTPRPELGGLTPAEIEAASRPAR